MRRRLSRRRRVFVLGKLTCIDIIWPKRESARKNGAQYYDVDAHNAIFPPPPPLPRVQRV